MKNIIVICLLIMSKLLYSQQISEDKKLTWINMLDSSDSNMEAIDSIKEYKIVEALPKLESTIWNRNELEQGIYISAIGYLKSPNTSIIAHKLLDTLTNYPQKYYTEDDSTISFSSSLKEGITEGLLSVDDYSTVNIIFESVSQGDASPSIMQILDTLINKNSAPPLVFQNAKSVLLSIVNDKQKFGVDERITALFILSKRFSSEMYDIIKDYHFHENEFWARLSALDYLKIINYPSLEDFIKENTLLENSALMRREYYEKIFYDYYSPANIKWLKERLKLDNDPTNKISLKAFLDYYVLIRGDVLAKPDEIIDTLNSYTEKCFQLLWIQNNSFKNVLNNYLSSSKIYLSNKDSLNSAKQINLYQGSIKKVFADSAGSLPNYINADAEKILNYYAQQILKKLPPLPSTKLINSQGLLLDGASLQYYEGAWKDAVNNNDGTFTIPTTLKTVSLRMNYAFGSQTKNNVAIGGDTIVFQTKNVQVKLQDSKGAILDTGKVQYYAGAWRDFGATTNGVVTKELLPLSYSFRMNYAFASLDKTQNVGTDPTVVFQTIPASVQLKNSSGSFIDAGTVQYYSGAWRDFGATTNGVVAKELLPLNYAFRMNYAFASLDKTQNVGTDPTIVFQTVPATVQLKNSSGSFIDAGTVQYYSGAWRDFGATTNGVVAKELLPLSYAFRMNYAFASLDKTQNIGADPTVVFQTIPATVQLKNSLGNFIDVGTVQYYSGAWRDFGATTNGIVSKELLPLSYAFRMNYAFASLDKTQNIGANPTVVFQTIPATVQLKNSLGNFIDVGTVQYYSGAWRDFGTTTNGVVIKELLPLSYAFRMTHEYVSLDKTQNVGTNNIVLFSTVLARISVTDNLNLPVNNALVSYYSGAWRQIGTTTNGVITKELLPVSLSFRAALGTKQADKTQNLGAGNNVEIKLP